MKQYRLGIVTTPCKMYSANPSHADWFVAKNEAVDTEPGSIKRTILLVTRYGCMVNRPPDFCPYCGTKLSSVDPPTAHYCESCDEYVFYNPIPTARLAVLNDDSILLVKVDTPDQELWGTPGGMVEADEDPDVAGARELREETTLTVDPDDLRLFDARSFAKFGTTHKTTLAYAVDFVDVEGSPEADDEVSEARFWTSSELDAVEDQLLTSWPTAYRDLEWWIEHARTALEGKGRSHMGS